MIALKPLPGRILVELREKYAHVATTEQKYDTKTSGICIDYFLPDNASDDLKHLFNDTVLMKLVFWEEYKDGAIIERDGKKYAFIKIEDLDGYEDEQVS
jgi:hypothetical protein